MSILDSKTPKGYSYCSCSPEFGVIFNPVYQKNGDPVHGIGFQYDWEADEDTNGKFLS